MSKQNTKERSTFLPTEDVPTFGNRGRRRSGRQVGIRRRFGLVSGVARVLFVGSVLKLVLPVGVMAAVATALWMHTPEMLRVALVRFLFAG